VSAEVVFCQNGLLTLRYVTVMGNHIIIRGSPLFGYPVLLLYVTLLHYCDDVLEITNYKKKKKKEDS